MSSIKGIEITALEGMGELRPGEPQVDDLDAIREEEGHPVALP